MWTPKEDEKPILPCVWKDLAHSGLVQSDTQVLLPRNPLSALAPKHCRLIGYISIYRF